MSADKIEDLESRITWQEVSLEEMNQVVLDQARRIERLEKSLAHVQQRLEELGRAGGGASAEGHEIPPHY